MKNTMGVRMLPNISSPMQVFV